MKILLADERIKKVRSWVLNSIELNPDTGILKSIRECNEFYDMGLNEKQIDALHHQIAEMRFL